MLRVYISNVFFLDKGYFPLKAFIEGVSLNKEKQWLL